MTQDKARKAAIRQHMAETGEPYSVARHAVEDAGPETAEPETPESAPQMTPDQQYVEEARAAGVPPEQIATHLAVYKAQEAADRARERADRAEEAAMAAEELAERAQEAADQAAGWADELEQDRAQIRADRAQEAVDRARERADLAEEAAVAAEERAELAWDALDGPASRPDWRTAWDDEDEVDLDEEDDATEFEFFVEPGRPVHGPAHFPVHGHPADARRAYPGPATVAAFPVPTYGTVPPMPPMPHMPPPPPVPVRPLMPPVPLPPVPPRAPRPPRPPR